jgi:hypothetical protein
MEKFRVSHYRPYHPIKDFNIYSINQFIFHVKHPLSTGKAMGGRRMGLSLAAFVLFLISTGVLFWFVSIPG